MAARKTAGRAKKEDSAVKSAAKTRTRKKAAAPVKEEPVVATVAPVEEAAPVKAEEKPVKAAAVEAKPAEKPVEKKEEKAEKKEEKVGKAAAKAEKVEKKEEKAAEKAAEAAPEAKPAKKPAEKKEEKAEKAEKKEEKAAEKAVEAAPAAAEAKPVEKPAQQKEEKVEKAEKVEKKEEKATAKAEKKEAKAAEKVEKKEEKATEKAKAAAKTEKKEEKTEKKEAAEVKEEAKKEEKKEEKEEEKEEKDKQADKKPAQAKAEPAAPVLPQPRRSIAFIGSECFPFVKTGGLGDVMSALPKALIAQNCDVRVIIPRYKCIKQEWQEKMVYKGAFDMDLCSDGKRYYVGIMEMQMDGVVYDFIDNEDFFSWGNPYTNLVDDIPKFCYFDKAALAVLNYLNWIPDIIHCHDWQAGLVPVFLREMFNTTPLARSKTIITIHNLRFQGVYNIPTLKYWTNLPDYVFNKDAMVQQWTEANMLKGGMTYSNMITTVSHTYAQEIQTPEYGEGLDAHLRYHSGKLRGIVNGIDTQIWDPSKDKLLEAPYSAKDVLKKKKKNKLALQKELGLEEDADKIVIGLISRLTDQKGLDLVNAILPQLIDGNTQFIVLGTGEPQYEDSFRYYENTYKGSVCSNIMYDEARSHQIYAGADALLVPSRFEPCGLTQLIAMHYGTIPIVRETGGLKDTVLPYNKYTNEGNGFTFDRYESGLLLDAINRAKTLYFTNREYWDDMVVRDMGKDVSWNVSARQYRQLYMELVPEY